jgi:segregation and condensation protein A
MAAEDIDEIPRIGRDIHQASAASPSKKQERQYPELDIQELLSALSDVMRRVEMFESHHIQLEKLSTRERMSQVLENIRGKQFVPFASLFNESEGRLGVVVTFLAIMELIRESLVEIVQNESFGPIHVKAKSS